MHTPTPTTSSSLSAPPARSSDTPRDAPPVRPRRRPWLVPAGLLVWTVIPALSAAYRLLMLAGALAPDPADARFSDAATSAVLHVVSGTLFCGLGALQFQPELRRRGHAWHRIAGRVLLPLGALTGASGIWLTVTYPPVFFDSFALSGSRILVSVAILVFLAVSTWALVRRRFDDHGAWVMRAYALAMGGGTQAFTSIPMLFESWQNETGRALTMGAGWAINVLVVEAILARRRRQLSQITQRSTDDQAPLGGRHRQR